MNRYLEEIEPYRIVPLSFDRVPQYDSFATHIGKLEAVRDRMVSQYGFAIPTPELVERFAAHGPIVSVGAGTAYLESLLADHTKVIPTDTHVGTDRRYGFTTEHMPVEALTGLEAVTKYPEHTLLISWPPHDDNCDIHLALRHTRARTFLYIGESRGGCTGNEEFWDAVDDLYHDEPDIIPIPQWYGIYDFAAVYTRRVK